MEQVYHGGTEMQEFTPLFVNEREAARLLSVSVAALRRWRREGRGPRVTRIEHCVRYRVSDLEAFMTPPLRTSPAGEAQRIIEAGLRPARRQR